MTHFVDHVVLHVAGGHGGHGCSSVHREKFKPLGGPDGGNGGRGGEVVLVVDSSATTLLDYHRSPHRRAGNGRPGMGDFRHGADGGDLTLPVPEGTTVRDESGAVIADLVVPGQRFVVAAGGRGGLGNASLASPRRKAPGFALLGEPGDQGDVVLEVRSMADVAFVGFPNAGKSSLVAALSAARPKIADYPFTTLVPNLGVVQAGSASDGVRFTVADVPGLIPGASTGKGLGLEFLRHVERCAAIVHVLDCATLDAGRDPVSDLDALLAELDAYPAADAEAGDVPLGRRPSLVVLNKVDVPEARDLAELVRPELTARGLRVFEVSTASHEGLGDLTWAMAELVTQARELAPPPAPARIVLMPAALDETGFTVSREHSAEEVLFRIRGRKPERWVRQTDFSNDEAVGYLADRLARLGVEEELLAAGAVSGSTVVIGASADAVVFDWEPTLAAGAELLGPRGSDLRLEAEHRPSRGQRRADYDALRAARRAARAELDTERAAGHFSADDPVDAPR